MLRSIEGGGFADPSLAAFRVSLTATLTASTVNQQRWPEQQHQDLKRKLKATPTAAISIDVNEGPQITTLINKKLVLLLK